MRNTLDTSLMAVISKRSILLLVQLVQQLFDRYAPRAYHPLSCQNSCDWCQLVDAVLLQTCCVSVRCRFPTRHLWKAHSLFEGGEDLFLYLPLRKASLRIGRGVGVLCAERVVELVRDIQIRVRS